MLNLSQSKGLSQLKLEAITNSALLIHLIRSFNRKLRWHCVLMKKKTFPSLKTGWRDSSSPWLKSLSKRLMMFLLRRKRKNKGAKMKLPWKRKSKGRSWSRSSKLTQNLSRDKKSVVSLSMSTSANLKKKKKSINGEKKIAKNANSKRR